MAKDDDDDAKAFRQSTHSHFLSKRPLSAAALSVNCVAFYNPYSSLFALGLGEKKAAKRLPESFRRRARSMLTSGGLDVGRHVSQRKP